MNLFTITPIRQVGFVDEQLFCIQYEREIIINLNYLISIYKRAYYGYSLNVGGELYWITDEDHERIMKELN